MKPILCISLLLFLTGLTQAAEQRTLTGTYNRGNPADSKPLKAVLTPEGTDSWKVAWQADWKGKPSLYTGTLTGNLQDGTFTGTGVAQNGKRTWTVEGKAVNGKLSFEHFETTGGKKGRTGSGTLE